MRKSLMTGHSGTVVLALWIRLLVLWTLEAYHNSSLFSIFLPIVPLSSLFVHLCSVSLLLLRPRTNLEVYLSCCRLFRPKETQCALWRQSLRARVAQVGGSSKIRRVTKGKSGSKARKSAGVPKVEHVGDELSELESLEQVAHVGIASSSKLEAVGELIPTGKTDIRLDTSEISEKCEVGLNPRFSSIFAEDPPAERLSSSFPPVGSAPGSTHVKDRDEEIGKAGQSQSAVMDSVLAPPESSLEDMNHSSQSSRQQF